MKKFSIVVILVLGFLLRLINLNQSFWLDEAAQVIESARPFWQQFDLAADFHPPLFHLILHFWMYLGKSEVWVRIPSVLFGVGSLILLYKLARALVTKRVALLAVLFLTISPYHIWYSQEARPYMLFVFLALFSTLMLIEGRWLLYALITALCFYSLYFAPFLIVSHLAYIIFIEKKHYKKFLFSFLISIIPFIPWIPFFKRQLQVGTAGSFSGWKEVVSVAPFKAIGLTFAKFIIGKTSLGNIFYGLILTPAVFLFFWSLLKMWTDKKEKATVLFFFLPFLSAVLISIFVPVIAPQRLIFLIPFFYLILAKGIDNLRKKWRIVFLLIIFGVSLYGLFDYYFNPYVQREQWRQAVSFVEQRSSGNDLVLFVFPDPFAPYLWYNKGIVEARGIASEFILRDRDLSDLLPVILGKKRVYLFQYLTGLTDPKDKVHLFLQSNQFKNTSIKDFPGVGFIYVYEK